MLNSTCQFLRWNNNILTRGFGSVLNKNLEKTLNQITLLGRVGQEPQKRGSEDHPVIVFSVATHVNYKQNEDDFIQKTDWHRICIFKPTLRETVYNYLKKGQRVLIHGRISYGEIKNDNGDSKVSTSIIADDVIFFHAV
ncbi:PREDICTED: single-stranded DNA-binding protein, mitochondrial [Ceratosolen solmsi marchali]|uniref:Single-stranded DNA-binding protein, mitochondrial n=1 Tax=Ceratosolen solmsi marchali TaxID=326594 RepID=A0AAJ7DZF6_9HYME|nr:PREDICTED: single-stranded DNA-binding protein, mitochondrial [Ceratosolen solmsi marchali]